jgi:hypothetical protein
MAGRLFELRDYRYVIYHIDEDQRKIGFEFRKEKKSPDDYSVFQKQGGLGFRSTSAHVIASHSWVKYVALLPDSADRQFQLRDERNLWVAQLCPAFELSLAKYESMKIPSTASGIYRYLNGKQIVYIGKGNIRKRLNEIGRNQWQFDKIEYSIISREDMQLKWEAYWIDRFKVANNGSLPVYNLVSGHQIQEPIPQTVTAQ